MYMKMKEKHSMLCVIYIMTFLLSLTEGDNLVRTYFNITSSNKTSNATTTTQPPFLPCALEIGVQKEKTLEVGCRLCDIPSGECTCEKQKFICFVLSTVTTPSPGNGTSIGPPSDDVKSPSLFQPIFDICIGCFAIFVNTVVLIVFLRGYHQLSRCNKLIGLLAFLDIIFAFFMMMVAIPKLWTGKWVYGEVLCVIAPNMQDLSVALAIGVILIIAIERYLGIIYPYKHWLTNRRFILLICLNFFSAIAIVTPAFVKSRLIDDHCVETFTEKQSEVYTWFLFVVYFYLPCVATLALYIRIIQHLKGLSKTSIFMIGSDKQKAKRLKDNERIMRIIITILVAFVLLTLPNKIYWIIKEYDDEILGPPSKTRADIEKDLKLFGFIPYALHITINPFIYSIIDRKFRRKVIQLFPCFSCCIGMKKTDMRSMTEPTFMTNDDEIEMKSVSCKR